MEKKELKATMDAHMKYLEMTKELGVVGLNEKF